MYSFELLEYIKKHNNMLGGNEILKVIDVKENPQITHIKFNNFNNRYLIETNDTYTLEFIAMPYQEIKAKKLIKPRK